MSTKKYNFITPSSQSIYDDVPLKVIKFYQICAFPNPKNGIFEIRETIINGNNDIDSYRTIHVHEKTKKRLLKSLRENRYRLYATNTLTYIEHPNCNDISLARSEMLNEDSIYSGFAPFDCGKEFCWRGIVP